MKWQIKKLFPLCAVALLVYTTPGVANGNDSSRNEKMQPACRNENCCRWTVDGEVLYWKPLGSNIVYNSEFFRGLLPDFFTEVEVINDEIFTETALDGFIERRIKSRNLRFDHDLGFRLGLAYKPAHSCWNFGINWTHFHSDAHGKASPIKEGVMCLIGQEFDYTIKTKWEIHLDYGDIGLWREFCLQQNVTLIPFASVRWVRLDQDYKSNADFRFSGRSSFSEVVLEGFSTRRQLTEILIANFETRLTDLFHVNQEHEFAGAGPRIGFELDWALGRCLNVFGMAAFSYIFGYSEHQVKDFIEEVDEFANDAFFDILEVEDDRIERDFIERNGRVDFVKCLKVQANRPMTDLVVGLRYVPVINCCPYLLSFQFAFEHHTFFGQKNARFNDLQTPLKNCTSTLAFYGISFSMNLSF